jgi:hypothetical protein
MFRSDYIKRIQLIVFQIHLFANVSPSVKESGHRFPALFCREE